MLLDYDFYTGEYGGKVTSTDFKSLNIKASGILNYYTFGRVANLVEGTVAMKYALCELVDLLNKEATQGSQISSEKVGSYSVTYANKEASTGDTYALQQKRIIHKWLPVELVYRGL